MEYHKFLDLLIKSIVLIQISNMNLATSQGFPDDNDFRIMVITDTKAIIKANNIDENYTLKIYFLEERGNDNCRFYLYSNATYNKEDEMWEFYGNYDETNQIGFYAILIETVQSPGCRDEIPPKFADITKRYPPIENHKLIDSNVILCNYSKILP